MKHPMSPALANIEQARALLVEVEEAVVNPIGTLGAAAFAASAAIAMAGVMILGPGVALENTIFDVPPSSVASNS